MKLEKREISLNERDSIQEIVYVQLHLLHAYVDGLFACEKRQTKNDLVACLQEGIEDLLFTLELQKNTNEKNEDVLG